jgi:hypothetical protein
MRFKAQIKAYGVESMARRKLRRTPHCFFCGRRHQSVKLRDISTYGKDGAVDGGFRQFACQWCKDITKIKTERVK